MSVTHLMRADDRTNACGSAEPTKLPGLHPVCPACAAADVPLAPIQYLFSEMPTPEFGTGYVPPIEDIVEWLRQR